VKDAKGDLPASTDVIARTDLAYYSGDDVLNLPLLSVGAVGMVSVVSHVCSPQLVALANAVDCGELEEARRINATIWPAIVGIMTRTQGAIMAKAALELLGQLSNRTTRLPLVDATAEQVAVLREDLRAAGLPV
jgi:4-hydroxy-tetrahydrodipicolinate synthase